jgi:hypothetical protein
MWLCAGARFIVYAMYQNYLVDLLAEILKVVSPLEVTGHSVLIIRPQSVIATCS